MNRVALAALVGVMLFQAGACTDESALPPQVYALMECIECGSGELAAVAALGDSAVPVLSQLLLEGPPQASLDAMRRSLLKLVADTATRASAPASLPSVVSKQLDDYVRLYRFRAAIGLGAIGGPAAHGALCEARSSGLSGALVGTAIDSALVRTGSGSCP